MEIIFFSILAGHIPDRTKRTTNKRKRKAESKSSTISSSAIHNIVEKLRTKQHRSSPSENYFSIWRNFNNFFLRLDEKPGSWEERLILFVGYLVKQKRKSSTIKSYISAIKSVLRDDGVILNEDKYLLTSLTRACRLKNDQVHIRLPIRKAMLQILLKNIHLVVPEQPYLILLYRAIFSTGYYGLFRIGELTEGSHPVMARDVQIGMNKNKLMFILRSSKTHGQDAKPQIIKISSRDFDSKSKLQKSTELYQSCPYEILRNYLKVRKSFIFPWEPFFVFKDCSLVQPYHVRKILKKTLLIAGFDPKLYSFHSLRGGRALDLHYTMHLSVESVKVLGRWKSNSVYLYLS